MSNGGLANLGLTCGINTLIQCIGHSTRLREIILKEEKQENKLTRQVSDVIRKLIIEKVSINPAGLIQQIYRSFKGRITQFEQHDIGELWMLISDKINEEIGIKYNEPDNEIDKVIHKYNNGLKSEWTETVQGISKTTIFCKNCKNSTYNYEIYSELALDMNEIDIKYITQLIQNLIGIEKLEDYVCDKCKCKECYKRYELLTIPDVLILTLKRFKMTNSGFERINNGVNVPLNITMNSSTKYKLIGMGNHFGNYHGGHYTALCLNNDKWVHYDDLNIKEIEKEIFIENNKSVYMLLYEKTI